MDRVAMGPIWLFISFYKSSPYHREYDCTVDLLFDWFGFDQSRKTESKQNNSNNSSNS